jgi:hypothetical protein
VEKRHKKPKPTRTRIRVVKNLWLKEVNRKLKAGW